VERVGELCCEKSREVCTHGEKIMISVGFQESCSLCEVRACSGMIVEGSH